MTKNILQKKKTVIQSQEILENDKVWTDPDTSIMWQVEVNDIEYTGKNLLNMPKN